MIPSSVRIFLCREPQDMRRGFERLALAAQRMTARDPRHGEALFCFVNRRRNRIKVLWHDGTGWCLLYKRLHGALFELGVVADGSKCMQIDRLRFAALLRGVRMRRRESRGRA